MATIPGTPNSTTNDKINNQNDTCENATMEKEDPMLTNQNTFRSSNTSRPNPASSSLHPPILFTGIDKFYEAPPPNLSYEHVNQHLLGSKSVPGLTTLIPLGMAAALEDRRLAVSERSTSLTMDDVSLLMREQDADLLESIRFDPKETPLMLPQTAPYTQPDDFCLDESPVKMTYAESWFGGELDETCHETYYPSLPATFAASTITETAAASTKASTTTSTTTTAAALPPASFAASAAVTSSDAPLPTPRGAPQTRRPTLSGQVWMHQSYIEDMTASCHSTSHIWTAEQVVPDNDEIRRTSSDVRRLNEAAQFAEAVGDVPNEGELRIIDDDKGGPENDSDDSSDEKSVEILIPNLLDKLPPNDPVRRKQRPQWPFATTRGFLHKLPDNGKTQDFIYKGIRANPPEIVKRGINRGNYAQLHRKAWLEVSDKYHRYGKNLRLYYRHWESLGCPTNSFFDWLDSKGEAAGQPLPNLDECTRAELDADTVLYITNPEVTDKYAIKFMSVDNGQAKVVDVDGDPVSTGPDGWIFVLRDNVMYGAQKVTSVSGHSKKRFHHSSFFGGKAVAAAGIFITDDHGILTKLYPHSGHYRPGEAHMQRVLFFLYNEGIDLRTFDMDMQQLLHVTRDKPTDSTGGIEKRKKIESLYLMPAVHVACFLAHKARFIGNGIFSQIHRIRKADVTSVSEALELIDDGAPSRSSVCTPISSA